MDLPNTFAWVVSIHLLISQRSFGHSSTWATLWTLLCVFTSGNSSLNYRGLFCFPLVILLDSCLCYCCYCFASLFHLLFDLVLIPFSSRWPSWLLVCSHGGFLRFFILSTTLSSQCSSYTRKWSPPEAVGRKSSNKPDWLKLAIPSFRVREPNSTRAKDKARKSVTITVENTAKEHRRVREGPYGRVGQQWDGLRGLRVPDVPNSGGLSSNSRNHRQQREADDGDCGRQTSALLELQAVGAHIQVLPPKRSAKSSSCCSRHSRDKNCSNNSFHSHHQRDRKWKRAGPGPAKNIYHFTSSIITYSTYSSPTTSSSTTTTCATYSPSTPHSTTCSPWAKMLSTPASSTTLAIPTTSWTQPPKTRPHQISTIARSQSHERLSQKSLLRTYSLPSLSPPSSPELFPVATPAEKESTSEPVPTDFTPKRSRRQAKVANKDLTDEQCRKAVALRTVGLESVTDYQLRKTLKPLLDCEKIDGLQPNKL